MAQPHMGCKNDAPSALRTAVSALRAFLIARHDPSSSSLVRCASQPEMRGHFDCRTRRKGQFLGVVLCFSFLISLPVFSITGTFQGRVVEGTKREAGKYIYVAGRGGLMRRVNIQKCRVRFGADVPPSRSEEHTSELQSRFDLVCRFLLEKKKDYWRGLLLFRVCSRMLIAV